MDSSSLAEHDDEAREQYFLSFATFYNTLPGLVVVTVTASLSALCSGVIILVIYKSRNTRLTSIYHRIIS